MPIMIRSFFILLALTASTAHAGARQQMMTFTKNLQGLSSPFEQTVYNPAGKATEKSTGLLKLKAPRQFRWQTLKPYPQTIVADGNHIWIYDPDLEQVTVRNQSAEESNSPLAVLIDSSEMDRQFKVTEAATSNGLEWLLLKPKKPDEAPFEKALLGFSAQGLVRMELYDGLGQRTVISFTQWQRNPKFAATDFTFTPPKGADVVGDVTPGATVTPIRD
ncbi:MAG TPA: outer membrane lipoprotein chaperone LolA [Arenimonas sp.]|nr:outer membrane lipoprotein chaperone LolA [Arenimonas sp.]HOZ05736.1 outer membrane lipoprotein chaperone LolA [Arenimonas sp.]HPO24020.1 outer membrane lipoprotein chaperone LolA [Arenimonas sp.]